jgi:cytochrome c biogenesis protein CcmG/thiol:disulfide interchange protein DsbE
MVLVPPVLFAALAGLFAAGLMRDNPDELPSALIGREAPRVPDEGLAGKTLLTEADLRMGEITIVNYWASWCPPCRAEHPTLISLAEQGFRVAGINFRDDPANALAYLSDETDPFFAHGFDPSGRVSIDWGVTAPPETFIVDGDGTVLFRIAGPLVGSAYEQRFLPALREAASGE